MTDQEINESVARKLGWTQIENDPNEPEDHDGLESGLRGFPPNVSDHFSTIPDYCHDIAAAWEIVENAKLSVIFFEGWFAGRWKDIEFSSNEGAVLTSIANKWVGHKSAPMAICLAFLKLKEVS